MPSLKKMLQSYDLDLIARISRFWGVEVENLDLASAVNLLFENMTAPGMLGEIIESLPETAREAWTGLGANEQKTTWAVFLRQHGDIRELGPAKRERDEPDLNPISTSEMLWYRGLIGKAFFNLPPEPREYVFIPDELVSLTEKKLKQSIPAWAVRPAGKVEVSRIQLADDSLLDHVTDWLASRRMRQPLPPSAWSAWEMTEAFIEQLAAEAGLTAADGLPDTEALKGFFHSNRGTILQMWFNVWKDSAKINELRMLPGMVCEGVWMNDPLSTRRFVMEVIQQLDDGIWFSLASLISEIKTRQPDFQRAAGDFDSWFIHREGSGESLRGFEHWDEIEGALIAFLITGPLHWLGLLDLAGKANSQTNTAFRRSKHFNTLATGNFAPEAIKESPVKIASDLIFTVPKNASRLVRYQIGRFCEVQDVSKNETRYAVTPASLHRAGEQNLTPRQLIHFLDRNKVSPLPKTLTLMADQWESNGLEAQVEKQILLRFKRQELLKILQQNPRTAKFIIEVISSTTAVINPNGIETIKKTLIEMGVLTQIDLVV